MRLLILMAMALGWHAANAEVFKCIGKAGRTVYQEKPCQAAVKEQVMDIKADPAKEAAAKARLEAFEAENDARRAERRQEEQEVAAEIYQAAKVNALNRSVFAQEQQAAAQRRQAEALEMRNQQLSNPWWLYPGHSSLGHSPGGRAERAEERDIRTQNRQNVRPEQISPFPASPSSSFRQNQ
ncbi:MAG: DUF4124 domain-containing protein [Methylomonas sp.]